jgi:hypothetical protein
MPYTVKHNPTLGVVEISFSGEVPGSELRSSTAEGIRLQERLGITKFLILMDGDCEIVATVMDIFALPTVQYLNLNLDKQSRIALVVPSSKSARDAARFYETACVNRNWIVRVLPDRPAALVWLNERELD